jgi:hypothetical protein
MMPLAASVAVTAAARASDTAAASASDTGKLDRGSLSGDLAFGLNGLSPQRHSADGALA